jgi:hypothetical protein
MVVPVLCAMKCAAERSPEARQTFDSSTRLAMSVRPVTPTRSISVKTCSTASASAPLKQPGSSAANTRRCTSTVDCNSVSTDTVSPTHARD